MPSKFCFYVHHHGAGHVMRAIAIAESMPSAAVTFMGSNLMRYAKHIPAHVTCLHLPADTRLPADQYYSHSQLSFLHYAPLNASGLLERNALMVDFFRRNPQIVLIVDVSAEVTLLARLCGIPTVVIRQHGQRTDLAHRLAYECAEMIIAPFAKEMDNSLDNPFFEDTTYVGGFSRYTGIKRANTAVDRQAVAILIGQGGSNLNLHFIKHFREAVDLKIPLHVIGPINDAPSLSNTVFHGQVDCPAEILSACDVVICNAGHNTVMELADLQKAMICIPAKRPFDEQIKKAAALEALNCAVVIPEAQLYHTDWALCIQKAQEIDRHRLKTLTNTQAIPTIENALENLYAGLFSIPSRKEIQHEQYG